MLIILAPALSIAALVVGGAATVVGIVLNGPWTIFRRRHNSTVLGPPVPCPGMDDPDDEDEFFRSVV